MEIAKEMQNKYGEEFLKEERRCDYLITSNMKLLWAIELDMLEKFIEVCSKYNLRFFAMYGTLLGAIRHKGFIPWDDDVDIAMPREDYEKLLEIGPKEFKYPYFFQSPYTDKYYGFSFVKIRNSETTSISPKLVRNSNNMNMGIMIDVFPLDMIREDKTSEIREEMTKLININIASMKKYSLFLEKNDYEVIEKYYNPNNELADTYYKMQTIARTYEKDPLSDIMTVVVTTISELTRYLFPKHCFDNFVYHNFEHLKLPCPSGFDEILKIHYGDYMKLPPLEKRGIWHDTIIYSDYPYDRGIKRWIKEKSKTQI